MADVSGSNRVKAYDEMTEQQVRDAMKDRAGLAAILAAIILSRGSNEVETAYDPASGVDQYKALTVGFALIQKGEVMGQQQAEEIIADNTAAGKR